MGPADWLIQYFQSAVNKFSPCSELFFPTNYYPLNHLDARKTDWNIEVDVNEPPSSIFNQQTEWNSPWEVSKFTKREHHDIILSRWLFICAWPNQRQKHAKLIVLRRRSLPRYLFVADIAGRLHIHTSIQEEKSSSVTNFNERANWVMLVHIIIIYFIC